MAKANGGPAQTRRRVRRAAERAQTAQAPSDPILTPELVASIAALSDDAETLADGSICANCDHAMSMHDGGTGACAMEGCDCASYSDADGDNDPGDADRDGMTAATVRLTFTSTDGAELAQDISVPFIGGWGNWTGITATGSDGDVVFRLADGSGGVDLQPRVELPDPNPSPATPEPPPPSNDNGMRWQGTIALEGSPTSDGRIFAPGAITWRELPLSLGAMMDTPHADVVTASPVIGRIDEIWRDGGLIRARGEFDSSELGTQVARMVGEGTLRGVSVDVAVSKMEIAYRSEILDENGNWKGGDEPAEKEDGPDLVDILFGAEDGDEIMFVMWEGTIGAVTVCPFPAFADAKIEVAKSLVAATQSEMVWTMSTQGGFAVTRIPLDADGLLASAALVEAPAAKPSADWFGNPNLTELTAMQIDDDRRIYGHLAPWDVCHIGIPGVCTVAPNSNTGYAYFHLKEVECDGGERVACGTLTMDTGHASPRLGRADATAHYDNTGTAVADLVCGEDEFGIWYSGALRPGLSDEDVRKLRGASVSGDWRNVNGNLEFVALLAVNVPGYPVPRARALVASVQDEPQVLALTAAGIVMPGDETIPARAAPVSADDLAKFAALGEVASGAYSDLAARIVAAAA